ncbi:hypothetical protein ACKAW1_19900 [Xanthomonas vasicola pv. vasculorum]|nr:hypothetical protein [Xanthomonas vasicola]
MRRMTHQTFWCPYTNQDLSLGQTSSEHIVPKSLGGSNAFQLPVCASYNSKEAAKIDSKMADEFLMLFRRSHFDARGHSRTAPTPVIRRAQLADGRPVQISFVKDEGMKVYDLRMRQYLDESEMTDLSVKGSFRVERSTRLKFMCKAALSAGARIYGDYFRTHFDHKSLREGMNFDSQKGISPDCQLRIYDEFSQVAEEDAGQTYISSKSCELTMGSCIHFIPGEERLASSLASWASGLGHSMSQHARTIFHGPMITISGMSSCWKIESSGNCLTAKWQVNTLLGSAGFRRLTANPRHD